MPEWPKGEKHLADVTGAAGKMATGEIQDITTEDGKNAAAVALGRMAFERERAQIQQRAVC